MQYYFKADPSTPNEQQEKELSGSQIEQEIFTKLQSTLKQADAKNTIVISGWEFKGLNGMLVGESDFLIVSLPLKSVIHIEAKRSQINPKSKGEKDPWQKAAEQLEKTRKICLKNIPFEASDSWRYFKFMFFQNTSNDLMDKICQACKDHILTPATNFNDWWGQFVAKRMPENDTTLSSKETYLQIIHFLVHQMFIQDDVLSKGNK